MARILLHAVDPRAGTGYAEQCGLWVPRFASLGHEVAISAFAGAPMAMSEWNGFAVYPGGNHRYGADVLPQNARHFRPDLVITLCDLWALGSSPFPAMPHVPAACWMPVDCKPLGHRDRGVLNNVRVTPVAMSRHGEQMIREAGSRPLYVPHGIDTSIFKPPEDRAELRRELDIHDRFVIGICATNNDGWRKGWFEQMSAFARLYRRHDDALLIGHTDPEADAGINLRVLAAQLGIEKAVKWTCDYSTEIGPQSPEGMAAMAGAEDLRSGCAWGEGFGLPIAEAEACGTPVVATDASAMSEVCGGWLVPGEEAYIREHQASWVKPTIDAIARVYEKAYRRGAAYHAKASKAREHAMQFDADTVLKQHWMPALEALL